MSEQIVIVGGGLAGAVAAESYRTAGGTRPVTLVTQEPDLPIHRPPLSKEYLRGDERREKLFVHPPEFYSESNITIRRDSRMNAIDLARKHVLLSNGESLAFHQLVLATGARPRKLPLPGADLPGVFLLRSLRSVDALGAALHGAKEAVIIGAGFIGMEVAATLTQRGLSCTVVEMAPRMWSRIVPGAVADAIQHRFEAKGVNFRFAAGVRGLEGDGHVQAVVLDTDEGLPADLVVAGVGVALNTEEASAAGLTVDGGVVVDEYFRTSHPDVYAIGDIANFPDPLGGRLHLEHWDNALNQGRALGKTLAGQAEPFDHVAYFFSDMFDLSINMIGYPSNWDETILLGKPEDGPFTTLYVKHGAVRAVLMLNDDAHFDAWTSLVRAGPRVEDIVYAKGEVPAPVAG